MLLDRLGALLLASPIGFRIWSSLEPADDGIRYFSLKDPNPEPGLAWFILNAFFFVGVAIVVTIGLGIAFGSFRYWLLERFPNNRFNGAPDDDPAVTLRLTDPTDPDERERERTASS